MTDTPTQLTCDEVLLQLGVSRDLLTDDERTQLDELGYVVLEGVLSDTEVEVLRARLDALLVEEGDRAGAEHMKEAGTGRLSDLPNKGSEFDVCYTHPRVLAAVWHVLGYRPFHLAGLVSRDVYKGQGMQGLHADGPPRVEPGVATTCQTTWLIDPFTAENGATRIVPGSHLLDHGPAEVMGDTTMPHPDEISLVGPAGAVAVFPGNMWHSGMVNRSGARRLSMFSFFSHRSVRQHLDQRAYIRPETYDRIGPAGRWILNVEGTREGYAAGMSHQEYAERAGIEPRWGPELKFTQRSTT